MPSCLSWAVPVEPPLLSLSIFHSGSRIKGDEQRPYEGTGFIQKVLAHLSGPIATLLVYVRTPFRGTLMGGWLRGLKRLSQKQL